MLSSVVLCLDSMGWVILSCFFLLGCLALSCVVLYRLVLSCVVLLFLELSSLVLCCVGLACVLLFYFVF